MSANPYVFEVVDSSNDEQYWSLGVFLDEQAAMSVLDADEPPYTDDDPECAVVEVRRREVGFKPHNYTTVASRQWVRNYEDDKPDWTAQPIKLTPTKGQP